MVLPADLGSETSRRACRLEDWSIWLPPAWGSFSQPAPHSSSPSAATNTHTHTQTCKSCYGSFLGQLDLKGHDFTKAPRAVGPLPRINLDGMSAFCFSSWSFAHLVQLSSWRPHGKLTHGIRLHHSVELLRASARSRQS